MPANQILVVDDEVGIRELLFEILRDEGYGVRLAENAQTARSARKEMRPDLVLLDIWMPDTDGITLLKEWAGSGLLTMPVPLSRTVSSTPPVPRLVATRMRGFSTPVSASMAFWKRLCSTWRSMAGSA